MDSDSDDSQKVFEQRNRQNFKIELPPIEQVDCALADEPISLPTSMGDEEEGFQEKRVELTPLFFHLL